MINRIYKTLRETNDATSTKLVAEVLATKLTDQEVVLLEEIALKNKNKQSAITTTISDIEAMTLAEKMYSIILSRYPYYSTYLDKYKMAKDIQSIRKMSGQFEYRLIEFVMDWALEDEFWGKNIRSSKAFKEQFVKNLLPNCQDQYRKLKLESV